MTLITKYINAKSLNRVCLLVLLLLTFNIFIKLFQSITIQLKGNLFTEVFHMLLSNLGNRLVKYQELQILDHKHGKIPVEKEKRSH